MCVLRADKLTDLLQRRRRTAETVAVVEAVYLGALCDGASLLCPPPSFSPPPPLDFFYPCPPPSSLIPPQKARSSSPSDAHTHTHTHTHYPVCFFISLTMIVHTVHTRIRFFLKIIVFFLSCQACPVVFLRYEIFLLKLICVIFLDIMCS